MYEHPQRLKLKKDIEKESFSITTSSKFQSLQFFEQASFICNNFVVFCSQKKSPQPKPKKRTNVNSLHLHCYIVTARSTLCNKVSVILQRLINSTRILDSCQIFLVFIFCSVHFFQFLCFESHCYKVLKEKIVLKKYYASAV